MTTSTNIPAVDQMLLDSEKLLEGYQNLLEMAKKQLESFDLSDEHIEKIAQKVQTEAIAEASGRAAADAIEKISDSISNDRGTINSRIDREVDNRITSLLQQGIYDKIRALIDTEDTKEFLLTRIRDASNTRYTELDEELQEGTRKKFRYFLAQAFNSEEICSLAAEHQANTSEQ